MDNKVVAHLRDGRLIKGTTTNFSPTRDMFHVTRADGETVEVFLAQLKAVFFVRSLQGDRAYRETKDLRGALGVGRKARCEFFDGEVITGFVAAYYPMRSGLFLTPSDPKSNNERIFVVKAATSSISFAEPPRPEDNKAAPARGRSSGSGTGTAPPDHLFGRPRPKRS